MRPQMIVRFMIAMLAIAASVHAAPEGPRTLSAAAEFSKRRGAFGGFETNQGQFDSQVRYALREPGRFVFLTDTEIVVSAATGSTKGGKEELSLSSPDDFRIRFAGSAGTARIEPLDELSGVSNYIRGGTAAIIGVRSFARVMYRDIYPGIDVIFHVGTDGLEYDFVVRPGSSADQVQVMVDAAGEVSLTRDGDALICMNRGPSIIQKKPKAYQGSDLDRTPIEVGYVLSDRSTLTLALGPYDRSQALIIDPVFDYSTYISGGGNASNQNENARGIFVDPARNVYITGDTKSPTFPTSGAPAYPTIQGGVDAFIIKYDANSNRVFSTFLGGTGDDIGYVITADASGYIYVAGTTFPGYSADTVNPGPTFPLTAGSLQTIPYRNNGVLNGPDLFVTKLFPTGAALVYSALIAGSFSQYPRAITLDTSNNVILAGQVTSGNSVAYFTPFPTTPNAYQRQSGVFYTAAGGAVSQFQAFVLKLNAGGSALSFSTFLGAGWESDLGGLAVDSKGNIWLAGYTHAKDFPVTPDGFQPTWTARDFFVPPYYIQEVRGWAGFVAKLSPDARRLLYATYLNGTDGNDQINAISIDADDSVYVTGESTSSDFPTTPGVYNRTAGDNVFVTKFSSAGTLQFSTFIGQGTGAAIGVNGEAIYVAGYTTRVGPFPLVTPTQATFGGETDAFLSRLNGDGSRLEFSTYLGGNNTDKANALALDAAGNVYVAGSTVSRNFPVTAGAAQTTGEGTDGFYSRYIFDTDGDGLLDVWETNGMDVNGDGTIDLNLPALGADPLHKDLFVELDYMSMAGHSHHPQHRPDDTLLPTDPIQTVISAFNNAPVQNPDGTTGIHLHVLVDEQLSEQSPLTFLGANSGFDAIKNGLPSNPCISGHFGTAADRASSNCSNILRAKRMVYRYGIFGHDHSDAVGSSGIAEPDGNDFMVTLRTAETVGIDYQKQANAWALRWGTTFDAEYSDMVAGAFMHELGHTLGLRHGGGLGLAEPTLRGVNCKPNYLSVMSYSRTFNFAAPDAANPTLPPIRTNRTVDYSRAALPSLNESALDEPVGISGPVGAITLFGQGQSGNGRAASAVAAIDWNGVNGVEPTPVSADVNFLQSIPYCTQNFGEVLDGHNDWAHLIYSFRSSSYYANGPRLEVTPPELTDVDISAAGLGELPPIVQIATPTAQQSFASGSAISITANATDPDGTVAKVDFLDGNTVVNSKTASPYTFSWVGASVGTHQLKARATDNVGGMADSLAVTIHVGCTASLMPSSAGASYFGGEASFGMTLAPGCAWTASSDSSWVIIGSASSGLGSVTVTYSVDPNPSATSRSATITIARQTFLVSQDPAPSFGAPADVVATGMTPTGAPVYIHVTWTTVGDVNYYEVAWSTDGVSYSSATTTFQSFVNLPNVSPLQAYLIKVRAVNSGGTASAYSTAHLATLARYSDDPIVPLVTTVKAQHILDLRTMINSMRQTAGLATAIWTNGGLAVGSPITATDITDLRSALNPARTALGYTAISFTDALAAGTPIRAVHLNQLRAGTKF